MKKEKRKVNSSLITGIIFFLIGIAIFSYPAVSNLLAEKNQTRAIDSYTDALASQNADYIEREWYRAEIYNDNLMDAPVLDPFNMEENEENSSSNYQEILNINGIMGYISIPKISVKLPIYHGTGEDAMKRGVGHIPSTSLPIGGNSTHSVLTSHTGLPTAELFTRLDELKENDYFFITVLNKTLAYKVFKIQTVLPSQLQTLQIADGKDIVTLVTCTPYGVNTHRLLVHGERTDDDVIPENIQAESEKHELLQFNYGTLSLATIMIFAIVVLIIILIYVSTNSRRSEDNDR